MRYGLHKGRQIVLVQVVPGIQTQTHSRRSLRGSHIAGQLFVLHWPTPGGGVGLGVQLDPISTHGAGGGHLLRDRVHEQAHPHAQRLAFGDQGLQARRIFGKAPAMVAGELAFAVGHKRHLLGPHLTHQVHQVVKRIALDVELTVRPSLHHRHQVLDIRGADMALIWTRMHGDALRTRLQAQLRGTRHTGNAQMPRVAQQGHFVDIDRQGGAVLAWIVHKLWMSIIIWRVFKCPTPQW